MAHNVGGSAVAIRPPLRKGVLRRLPKQSVILGPAALSAHGRNLEPALIARLISSQNDALTSLVAAAIVPPVAIIASGWPSLSTACAGWPTSVVLG